MEWIIQLFTGLKELLDDIEVFGVSFWVLLVSCFGYRVIIKLFLPGGDKIGHE